MLRAPSESEMFSNLWRAREKPEDLDDLYELIISFILRRAELFSHTSICIPRQQGSHCSSIPSIESLSAIRVKIQRNGGCNKQQYLSKIFAWTMLNHSQLIPPAYKSLKISSTPPDISKQLSKSSISSKSQSNQPSLENQIVQLKEKAHQSFMQVIQMQQLHEEELQLLRFQFTEKEADYQLKIAELELRLKQNEDLQLRVKQLEYENVTLEKNFKHHICDFEQDDLTIDNIELITCHEESKLDDSVIINFEEIININKRDEQMACIQEEMKKEIMLITFNFPEKGEDSNIYKMSEKVFEYIAFMKGEFIKLQEKNIEKQRETKENKETQNSKVYDSLQKESKFMAEHIKRLSAEKMKIQKKLLETERHVKSLEDRLKKIEANLSKRGIRLDEIKYKSPTTFLEEHEKSLEINEFIMQNIKSSTSNPIHKTQYGLIRKAKN